MRLEINQLGAVGLVLDGDPTQIQKNAITNALNVRFNGREVEGYAGNYLDPYYTTRQDSTVDLLSRQWILQPVIFDSLSSGARLIIGAGIINTDDVEAFGFTMQGMDGAAFAALPIAEGVDLSGWPVSGTPWNIQSGIISNSVYFTVPGQLPLGKAYDWTGVDTLPGWGEQTLGNDGVTSDIVVRTWHCKKIIAFDNRLIAMNMTEESAGGALIPLPNRMRWSGFAHENAFPINWDDTALNRIPEDAAAATVDGFAGWQGITTQSQIIDAVANGSTLYVYTERETFAMSSSGNANAPFVTKQIYSDLGCLDVGCVVNAHGYNYLFTGSDVVRHDAVSWESIADGAVRDFIADYASTCPVGAIKLVGYPELSEIWLLMPSGVQADNDAGKTVALTYNYLKRTWSRKRLPYITAPVVAQVSPSSTARTWDSFEETWEEIERPWGAGDIKVAQGTLIAPGVMGGVYVLNDGATETSLAYVGGVYQMVTGPLESYIERSGLLLNPGRRAAITKTALKGRGGEVVTVATGGADHQDAGYIWEEQEINLATDRVNTWLTEGGAHAYRIKITGGGAIPAALDITFEDTGQ